MSFLDKAKQALGLAKDRTGQPADQHGEDEQAATGSKAPEEPASRADPTQPVDQTEPTDRPDPLAPDSEDPNRP